MVEATEASEVCARCDGTGWRLVEEESGEMVRRCDCAEGRRRERLLLKSGIPTRYGHCTLDSLEIWNEDDPSLPRARRNVTEFVDLYPKTSKQGLLLMGPVGAGKTHLAVAAMQALIRNKGVQARFADFTSLVLSIQMTFDGGGDKRGIMEPLIEADLLVLDELGAGKTSQWVSDLLYFLVNSRYLEQRATIFTTNYSDTPRAGHESFGDRISRRVRSRLFEMCQKIELRGGDYRKHRFADPKYERNA